jgi:hypothetical protein
MTWRVEVMGVRQRDNGLRWQLLASNGDEGTTVIADTTIRGTVTWREAGEYVGTTGSDELDRIVGEAIQRMLATRRTMRSLNAAHRRRRAA